MRDGRSVYFHKLDALLMYIEEPARAACVRFLEENEELLQSTPGSSHNHQAWKGGYVDHVTEVMNIALQLHPVYERIRKLPFTLSDALLVLFWHDVEKPWRYVVNGGGVIGEASNIRTRAEKADWRNHKIAQYGVTLTPEQENAFRYVEGEVDDYSSKRRVMNELAAFCHVCDVTSARIWYDHPRAEKEPVLGSRRSSKP